MRKDLCSTALKGGNASTGYQVIMAVWVNDTDLNRWKLRQKREQDWEDERKTIVWYLV